MAVSVILKTLNEEARIGPAIESVRAALEGIGGEIIVADGGSRDHTLGVAANASSSLNRRSARAAASVRSSASSTAASPSSA